MSKNKYHETEIAVLPSIGMIESPYTSEQNSFRQRAECLVIHTVTPGQFASCERGMTAQMTRHGVMSRSSGPGELWSERGESLGPYLPIFQENANIRDLSAAMGCKC